MDLRISLIVPTRGRPKELERLLASIAATADRLDSIEVVLVIDADDSASPQMTCDDLTITRVFVPPGLTMGALNMAGYEAASGDLLMLLNDDVVARTPSWDTCIRKCFAAFADGIVLVHVNDTVFEKALCTFPVVSRTFCQLAGGICPREYRRYRIDDHVEDIFNLLGILGERRSIYLDDVIFEHRNYVTNEHGKRQYFSEENTLALDAQLFDAQFAWRKELAFRIMQYLAPDASLRKQNSWRSKLAGVTDSFALRRPERLRVVRAADLAGRSALCRHEPWLSDWRRKIGAHIAEKGYRGLARAAGRKLLRGLGVSR